jgi:hypothetical protein
MKDAVCTAYTNPREHTLFPAKRPHHGHLLVPSKARVPSRRTEVNGLIALGSPRSNMPEYVHSSPAPRPLWRALPTLNCAVAALNSKLIWCGVV